MINKLSINFKLSPNIQLFFDSLTTYAILGGIPARTTSCRNKSSPSGNYDQIEKGMPDQARTSGLERIDIVYAGCGAHVLDFAFYFDVGEDYDL